MDSHPTLPLGIMLYIRRGSHLTPPTLALVTQVTPMQMPPGKIQITLIMTVTGATGVTIALAMDTIHDHADLPSMIITREVAMT